MPDFVQYLRGDDLLTVSGDAVYADTRVNPDGTLDISRWTRPQHDGPPLRALAVLRWLRTLRSRHARASETVSADTLADAERLLRIDLALTAAHWREPSLDIWEEELGHHYFTLRVSAAALNEGAEWLRAAGEATEATALRTEAQAIRETLDRFWLPDAGYYRSRIMPRRRGVDQDARHRGDPRAPSTPVTATRSTPCAMLECTPRSKSSSSCSTGCIRSIATGRASAPPRWAGTKATSTIPAAPTISRRSAPRSSVSWPPRPTRPAATSAREVGRARRRISRNRSRLHAGERRSFRAVRSTHRRANVREASRVELCRFHLVRDGTPSGGSRHDRSLRHEQRGGPRRGRASGGHRVRPA